MLYEVITLDFRKLEQDKMQLQAIETNLNVFVSDVYESFRDYADQRNISLRNNFV